MARPGLKHQYPRTRAGEEEGDVGAVTTRVPQQEEAIFEPKSLQTTSHYGTFTTVYYACLPVSLRYGSIYIPI